MGDVIDIKSGSEQVEARAEKPKKSKRQTKLVHPNMNRGYIPEIGERICELIAGGMSYTQVQNVMKDAPSWHNLTKWKVENREFDKLYRAARLAQAELFVDQMIDIADTSRDAAMAAVRIKARQWLAAKRLPQTYGDAVKLEIEDTSAPVMSSFEIARRLAFALSLGKGKESTAIIDGDLSKTPLDFAEGKESAAITLCEDANGEG